jgi:hypothetical protein
VRWLCWRDLTDCTLPTAAPLAIALPSSPATAALWRTSRLAFACGLTCGCASVRGGGCVSTAAESKFESGCIGFIIAIPTSCKEPPLLPPPLSPPPSLSSSSSSSPSSSLSNASACDGFLPIEPLRISFKALDIADALVEDTQRIYDVGEIQRIYDGRRDPTECRKGGQQVSQQGKRCMYGSKTLCTLSALRSPRSH